MALGIFYFLSPTHHPVSLIQRHVHVCVLKSPHKYTSYQVRPFYPAVVFEYVGFSGVNGIGILLAAPMSQLENRFM